MIIKKYVVYTCNHVEKVGTIYQSRDVVIDANMDNFVINLADDSSEDDDSDSGTDTASETELLWYVWNILYWLICDIEISILQ